MKTLKILLGISFGFVTFIGLGIAFLYYSMSYFEVRISSYSDMEAAREDQTIGRGALPGYVPEGTVSIKHIYNMDTNQKCLRFKVPNDDFDIVLEAIASKGFIPTSNRVPPLPTFYRGSCNFEVEEIEVSDYMFVDSITHGGFRRAIAANRGSGTFYYWGNYLDASS